MPPDDAKRRAAARSLCAELYDDDCPPPRGGGRERTDPAADRKTLQLCAQVRRVLESILPSSGHAGLIDALVERVEPAPDASRLSVVVSVPPDTPHSPAAIRATLASAAGHYRAEIAAAITRKRVPTLIFELIPRNESA